MLASNTDQNVAARAAHCPEVPLDLDPRSVPTRADARTDEQLLAAHRSGEPDAFRLLVHRYQRELYHFLVRFLGNQAAADDVFQDAFLQVHQSADQFDPSRRFKPWLFTIAANKARDLLRSQSRRQTTSLQTSIDGGEEDGNEFLSILPSTDESPSQPLEREELRAKVQAVVQGMPPNLREVLLLSYFNEFPYKQVAEVLGIPLGTVKSRMHAAVANFAKRWRRANPTAASS